MHLFSRPCAAVIGLGRMTGGYSWLLQRVRNNDNERNPFLSSPISTIRIHEGDNYFAATTAGDKFLFAFKRFLYDTYVQNRTE